MAKRIKDKYTIDQLKEMYINLSIKLQKTEFGASMRDINKSEDIPFSYHYFIFRFGSLENLRKECDYLVPDIPAFKKQYTKKAVKKLLFNTGRMTDKQIENDKRLPSKYTIKKLFKTTNMGDVWDELKLYAV